jgi:hypothetical protein
VPIVVIEKSIRAFLAQLGPLHDCAGLSNPFANKEPAENSNNVRARVRNDAKTLMDDWTADSVVLLQQQVDIRAFEANVRQKNRIPTESVFDTSCSLAKHAQRRERRTHWRRVSEEVDVFVSSGGVLVGGDLSAAEEFDAVQRLRKFLQDFGADVSFDRSSWNRVIMVVVRSTLGNSSSVQCDIKEANVIRCMQENDKYLLLVPYSILKNDKTSALLEAIRFHLPMARLSSQFYD